MWFTEAPNIMLHHGWPLTHWDELAGTLSVFSTRIWLDWYQFQTYLYSQIVALATLAPHAVDHMVT